MILLFIIKGKNMKIILNLKQAIVLLIGILVLISGALYLYLPKVMEENTIKNIVKSSKEDVKRLQIVREYYTKYIVSDIKANAPALGFHYDHEDVDDMVPFPTTVIHNLTKMYSKSSDVKFEFYSEFPFLNRKDRILTKFQKEAIKMVEQSEDGVYYKKDFIDGKKVLRVAVADYMILPACVNCHNTHPLKDWDSDKWKLGDKRGIIEIITPLEL